MKRPAGPGPVRALAALALWTGLALPPPRQAQAQVQAQAAAAGGLDEARELARRGDSSAALAAVESLIAERPQHVEARLLRGLLLERDGRSDEAIAAFRALTADRPDLPEPHNNLAVLYAAQGRYEEAREALLAALRLAPDYAVAHENLGDVYAKLAALAYSQAARVDPALTSAADKRAAAERLLERRPGAPAEPMRAAPSQANRRAAAPAAAAAPPADGRAPEEPAPRASARPAPACVQVEAADARGARRAAQWLRERGLDAQVADQAPAPAAHRVIVAPLADLDAARREVARLQAAGITDLILISRGEYANGISLGVYGREEGARRRVRDLAARGVNARIAPHRVRAGEAGTARVSARGAFDPRSFAQAFPDLPFEVADCPR